MYLCYSLSVFLSLSHTHYVWICVCASVCIAFMLFLLIAYFITLNIFYSCLFISIKCLAFFLRDVECLPNNITLFCVESTKLGYKYDFEALRGLSVLANLCKTFDEWKKKKTLSSQFLLFFYSTFKDVKQIEWMNKMVSFYVKSNLLNLPHLRFFPN